MITLKKDGLKIKNTETNSFEEVIGFLAPQGAKGDKGDTPQRGEEYWTDEDIAAIHLYIDEALAKLPPSVKITASTEDLIAGESPLADGEVYLVYE